MSSFRRDKSNQNSQEFLCNLPCRSLYWNLFSSQPLDLDSNSVHAHPNYVSLNRSASPSRNCSATVRLECCYNLHTPSFSYGAKMGRMDRTNPPAARRSPYLTLPVLQTGTVAAIGWLQRYPYLYCHELQPHVVTTPTCKPFMWRSLDSSL